MWRLRASGRTAGSTSSGAIQPFWSSQNRSRPSRFTNLSAKIDGKLWCFRWWNAVKCRRFAAPTPKSTSGSPKPAMRRYVEKLFRSLKVSDPHCKLTITGGINRPPMERKAGTIALFKKARTLAAELGFDLEEAATGGGSDGNFTAALGVPTLDGMGAVGEGAHAAHESVVIEHLVPRTALLAAMIASVE